MVKYSILFCALIPLTITNIKKYTFWYYFWN